MFFLRGGNPRELPKLTAPAESPWGHLGEGSLACNTCERREMKRVFTDRVRHNPFLASLATFLAK